MVSKSWEDWSDHRTSGRLSSGKEKGALGEVDEGQCVCSTESEEESRREQMKQGSWGGFLTCIMSVVGSHQRVFSQVESEWDLCFERIVLLPCGRTDGGNQRVNCNSPGRRWWPLGLE